MIIVFLKGVIKQKTLPYIPEHDKSAEATSQAGRRGLGRGKQRGQQEQKVIGKMKKVYNKVKGKFRI